MSRIYFTSEKEETEVHGRERARFGCMISDMGLTPLLPLCMSYTDSPPKIFELLPEDCYLRTVPSKSREWYGRDAHDFERAFRTWYRGADADNDMLEVYGIKHNIFDISLNTAIVMGSDPIKMGARIHGQCEIHAYIEGTNRAWVASIIEQGLDTHVYSNDVGWEPTIEMLKKEDNSPVVMSYSVCDEFPNQDVVNYKDETAWHELTSHERWDLAMGELRKQNSGLEIRPDYWENYRFGDMATSFDIIAAVYK